MAAPINDEAFKLVDHILDCCGLSSIPKERMSSFKLEIAMNAFPQITVGFVPDGLTVPVVKKFNLVADPLPVDVTTRSHEYTELRK